MGERDKAGAARAPSANSSVPARSDGQWLRWIVPAALGLTALAIVVMARPNYDLILAASPATQVHLFAAIAALALGAVMLTSLKGRAFHRAAGWVWAATMLILAVSSLFITALNPGHWSPIHVSTGLALILTPLAVLAARGHRVKTHGTLMMVPFYGFLLLSGALAFIPGRLKWRVFLGH